MLEWLQLKSKECAVLIQLLMALQDYLNLVFFIAPG